MNPQTSNHSTPPSILAWMIQANGFNRPGGAGITKLQTSDADSRDGLNTSHAAILKIAMDSKTGVTTPGINDLVVKLTGGTVRNLAQETTKLRQRGLLEKTGEIKRGPSTTYIYRISELGKKTITAWIEKFGSPI